VAARALMNINELVDGVAKATAIRWTDDGLPPRTFAWTVSSELLGFYFYFFLIFSFMGRAQD